MTTIRFGELRLHRTSIRRHMGDKVLKQLEAQQKTFFMPYFFLQNFGIHAQVKGVANINPPGKPKKPGIRLQLTDALGKPLPEASTSTGNKKNFAEFLALGLSFGIHHLGQERNRLSRFFTQFSSLLDRYKPEPPKPEGKGSST